MVYEDYIIYIYIYMCVCVCGGGGDRASDIHPSFVLGLRPIITCKKKTIVIMTTQKTMSRIILSSASQG